MDTVIIMLVQRRTLIANDLYGRKGQRLSFLS